MQIRQQPVVRGRQTSLACHVDDENDLLRLHLITQSHNLTINVHDFYFLELTGFLLELLFARLERYLCYQSTHTLFDFLSLN